MSTKTGGDLKLTKPAYGEKADVNVINTNMETIDTNFTSMFNNLNDKAEYVRLVSTDDSWAAVWTKLSAIKQAYTYLIYIYTTPFDVLAGTSGTSVSYSGTVLRTSASDFTFLLTNSSTNVVSIRITGANEVSAGTRKITTYRANYLYLTSSDTTWSSIWNKLNALDLYHTATFYAVNAAFNVLSGGNRNNTVSGTIVPATVSNGAKTFWMILRTSSEGMYLAKITNATSSSSGTYEEFRMLRENEYSYPKGEISMSFYGYGMITTSAKAIYFYIPMDKILPSGTYTVSSLNIRVRGVSGYVDDLHPLEVIGASGFTTQAESAHNGRCIRFIVTKSTALTNATNETPVTVNGTFTVQIS